MGRISWRIPKTWVVVLLASLGMSLLTAQRAEACSCLPATVESSYNNSTDVAMVKVNAGFVWGGTRYYLGTVQKPFKGCSDDGEPVVIRTAASSAACGTQFSVGESYLINGNKQGSLFGISIVSTNLCAYNLEVADLTAEDLDFLFGRNVCCGNDCACADGTDPVACFANPCDVAAPCPDGECFSNYCGGCNAEFYDEGGYAVCESSSNQCVSDADCAPDQWCRQVDPSGGDPAGEVYECVSFVGEGESCNGFTLPWFYERCVEGLVCDPVEETGDLPGICKVPCQSDVDCSAGEHCTASGLCEAEANNGCYSDAECAAGFRCNAAEICLPPPGCDPGAVCPTVCYGQCVAADPSACASDADCMTTGCSGQICAAQDIITTCEWREEYACYTEPYTSCGCQQGVCGWAPSPELDQCLSEAGNGAIVSQ